MRCHGGVSPAWPWGGKVGVDDYLAQGHTLEEIKALAGIEPSPPAVKATVRYVIEDGCICWMKRGADGEVVVPLCNFTARAVEDIVKDNGVEETRFFTMEGSLSNGRPLHRVLIPASSFSSLSWIPERWGLGAIVTAGTTAKDRLREAMQLLSQDAPQRRVYAHTGWRDVGVGRGFLTATGAICLPGVEVELEGRLQRYRLPTEPPANTKDAVRASLGFLGVGEPQVTLPLWSAIYLAPLSEILDPAFMLWLVGPTGAYKSTISALALCHFGTFTVRSLPVSWRDTVNHLEKMMALAKDIPLVIDDWAPPQDVRKAREYEAKAEEVARAQGNRLGRGRLRADTSTRPAYMPRGVVISSGEQLPGGQSHTARLFCIEVEPGVIDRDRLTAAQRMAGLYPSAMAGYIRWLAGHWADIAEGLPRSWETWRDHAQVAGEHARLSEDVAWLYAGFDLAMAFSEEIGAITHKEAQDYRVLAWDTMLKLAATQGAVVEAESPSRRFLEGLKALMDEGKVVFRHKDEEGARGSPWETPIGWRGDEGFLYLNPKSAYAAVYDFCRRSGEFLPFKANSVWKDLRRRRLTACEDGRTQVVLWVGGEPKRVVKLKLEALRNA